MEITYQSIKENDRYQNNIGKYDLAIALAALGYANSSKEAYEQVRMCQRIKCLYRS